MKTQKSAYPKVQKAQVSEQFLLNNITIQRNISEKCGENQYLGCGERICPHFCGSHRDPICASSRFTCKYHCFCKPGYVKVTNENCIPIEQCPKIFYRDDWTKNINLINFCVFSFKFANKNRKIKSRIVNGFSKFKEAFSASKAFSFFSASNNLLNVFDSESMLRFFFRTLPYFRLMLFQLTSFVYSHF